MSFTVSLPDGSVQLSGNPVNVVATTTTTGKTNHFLLFNIACNDNSIPYGPWNEMVPVSATQGGGTATLDIHALLDTDFNYNFSKIFTSSAAKVYAHSQLAANFTISVGETYIDTDGSRFETDFTGQGIVSITLKVLKGGLSNTEYTILKENNKSFYSEWMTNVHFLTSQPKKITLPRAAWLKLWFTPATTGNVSVNVYGYYADNSMLNQVHIFNAVDSNMYEINANLDVWADITNINSGYPLTHYSISIENDDWFEEIIISIDKTYYESENYFYNANKLGGVDLLHCTGNLLELPETTGETFTRRLPVNPTSKDATIISDRKTIARKFKCNTGLLSVEQRRALLDFLSTPYVWWKTDRFIINSIVTTSLIPVIIMPGNFSINVTSEDLMSIDFEFEIAHIDKY